MSAVPHWSLIATHLALICWYFFVKSRIGRSSPAAIRAMCASGIAVAAAHAVLMAFGAAPTLGQGLLGFVIDAGLVVLFRVRWSEARDEARS